MAALFALTSPAVAQDSAITVPNPAPAPLPDAIADDPNRTDPLGLRPGEIAPPPEPPPSAPPEFNASGQRQIGFEATELGYDEASDTVTAAGNVILTSGDQSLRAEQVTWNRATGEIVAEGNIRLIDPDGNQLFTDRMVLTDELKAGAMSNLLLAFRQGGRLAAEQATRAENGDAELLRAAYSSCAPLDVDGCPKSPSWRVTAERVFYDESSREIRFQGGYLELFGARLLPLPGLTMRVDGGPKSGLFIPDIAFTASNGVELSGDYYMRLAENRDLTLSGYVYTAAAPMVAANYRQLTRRGAFQTTAYLTYGERIPINSTQPEPTDGLRGYFATNGRFQLDPHWSVSGSLRLASDRTFLRRYDISREDRIRSTIAAERVDTNSYLSIAGWATQALLVNTDQGQVPLALPLIDYRLRMADPVLGGRVEVQANTLSVQRSEGQDTRRAFVRGQWDMRRVTNWGQEVTLTAMVRGDVYHSTDNLLEVTQSYRGESGWQGRGVALGAVDVKWPLIGSFLHGTQMFTPRVQLVATPPIRNMEIPNEDSRAFDLEDSNLFALNRFPGYDRVEDGARVTYGADWEFNLPGWRILTTVGQSYRLSDKPALFPEGTGLTDEFSDVVGRTEVRFRDFIKLTHRFRLDKDNLGIRRAEFDATVGTDRTYIELGYLRLNRDIEETFEDLQDREELRAAGRIAFARNWSVFGSAVVNLTDRDEDPTLVADGFEPLRTRLGFAYSDDCLELGVSWRRDYIRVADADSGNSFRLYFSLRNIGFR
jgi:LPS-assembly protein